MKHQILKSFQYLILPFFLLLFSTVYSQVQTPKYIKTCAVSNGYYEYLPKGYSVGSTQKYPLLLFSHGTGENGDGSTSQIQRVLAHGTPQQISEGIFPESFVVNGQTFSYIVISPQYTADPTVDEENQIIDYAVKNYNVDTNRIYMTGLSQGGGVIWRYCGYSVTYGKRIAAIVPVAGGLGPTTQRGQNIAAANIAVWATHNNGDPVVPVSYTIAYINYINSAPSPPNPLAKKTIFQNNTHDAWTQTYDLNFKENNLNVYEWMLQFSRANGTLAISGLNFYANKKDDNTVSLTWQTFAENNNKGFTIERSAEGNSFDSVDFVASLSVNGRGASYSFTSSAISGINYYRLKQLNYDGSYTYSPVRFIKFDSNGLLEIYPNPVQDVMHVKTGIAFNDAQMKIYNVQGKMMMQKIVTGNGTINVTVQGLPAGIYIAKIISTSRELQFRFVKE